VRDDAIFRWLVFASTVIFVFIIASMSFRHG